MTPAVTSKLLKSTTLKSDDTIKYLQTDKQDTDIYMQEASKTYGQSLKMKTVSLGVQVGIAKLYRYSQPSSFTVSNSPDFALPL